MSGVERFSSYCNDRNVDLHALTFSLSNVHSALLYPNHGKAPLCRILGVSLSLFWSIPQITAGVLAFNSRGSASKTARPLGFLGTNAWESFWSETNGSQASQTNCRPIGLECIESAYLQQLPASYHTDVHTDTPIPSVGNCLSLLTFHLSSTDAPRLT